MTTPTHRYTGTAWYRPDGLVHAGDEVTPTDAELRAFSDTLEPLDSGDADEGDSADDVEGGESERVGVGEGSPADRTFTTSEAKNVLSAAGVAADDYSELRSLASDIEGVKGNLGKDELQVALAAYFHAYPDDAPE